MIDSTGGRTRVPLKLQASSTPLLRLNSIESMSTVDGPGLRFVVFLQGCSLRCKFCHNPETWDCNGGELVSGDDILDKLALCRRFMPNLGLTISGGEPLVQLQGCRELLMRAKAMGISTALDTSGYGCSSGFSSLLPYVDVLLFDIKAVDPDLHRSITGLANDRILRNLEVASLSDTRIWVRRVLIPGVNDSTEEAVRLGSLLASCRGVEKVDVLPYHRMGLEKWKRMGLVCPYSEVEVPDQPQITSFRSKVAAARSAARFDTRGMTRVS
jgi:pyruvate formate lyase activating enzyme